MSHAHVLVASVIFLPFVFSEQAFPAGIDEVMKFVVVRASFNVVPRGLLLQTSRDVDDATKDIGPNENEKDVLESLQLHASAVLQSDLASTEMELKLSQVQS